MLKASTKTIAIAYLKVMLAVDEFITAAEDARLAVIAVAGRFRLAISTWLKYQ